MKIFIIAIVLVFSFSKELFAQSPQLEIILTDKDGLPQNKVKSLVYDKYKYIWIGTQNGISKYNGYSFKNYSGILGKEVTALFLDNINNLWIGTREGLYVLDRVSDKLVFVSADYIRDITQYKQNIYFITPDHIFCLNKERQITQIKMSDRFYDLRKLVFYKGYLHIGFGKNNGLKKFELKSNKITHINNIVNNSTIYCLKIIDEKLWVGTSTGKLYVQKMSNLDSIPLKNNHPIQDISAVRNNIWVGTDGNGIFTLKNNYVLDKHYFDLPNKKNEIGSNNVHCILTTNNSDVWVGTNDSGLSYFSTSQDQFVNLSQLYEPAFTHLDKTSTTCFEDSNQNLFFGTNFGLTKINPITNKSNSISLTQSISQIGGSKILSIFESNDKNIWVGTFDGGFGRFTKELKFKNIYFPFSNGSKNQQAINFIYNYSKNKILINSMYNGLGIFDMNEEKMRKIPLVSSDTLINYQTQTVRKFNDEIYAYIFDKDVCYLDRKGNVLKPLFSPPSQINDLYKNNDGTFWLATRGSGLFLVNEKGKILKSFSTKDGLSSNFLLRIEKDDFNALWVSSICGLTKIDSLYRISTFDHRSGLPSREFKPFASTKLRNGNIIFGTLQGFVLIDTKKQNSNLDLPKVIISDIKFQNESIKTLDNEKLLITPIEDISEIKIPFKRNSFSLHFHNDDYDLPKTSKYKYRMLALEREWINIDENTQTSYTNLTPGNYTFQVLSTNKNKIWSKLPTELNIEILSPWYWSKFTISIYIILLSSLLFFIYRIIIFRINIGKEREFSQYKLQATKELNEKKINFFTNVSHDIKTPLSLISAPLDLLLNDNQINHKSRENLYLIKKNTDRLLQLIKDILDFRKIDTNNKLSLEISKVNMDILLKDLFDSFNKTCIKKNIKLNLTNSCVKGVYIDNNKVKRILWNLVSNSLVYSQEGSYINISCKINEGEHPKLEISINDSGKGINKKELKHLFEPYFQGENPKVQFNEGTGLGLTIVKNLIESHRGEIKIDSVLGKGTTFTLTLPYVKKDYMQQELKTLAIEKNYSSTKVSIIQNKGGKLKYNLSTIFIVEDNIELNEFLTNLLKSKYKVYSYYNGAEALQAAKRKIPEIIISDVLMPIMNGYTLCEKIKTNFLTSHIPIILLTANSSVDQQVEGMQIGADIYLTKPFKPEFLLASINSVLYNRDKLRTKFQQPNSIKGDEDIITNRDKEFINSLKNFIQENIENEKLSIDIICKTLNCSKSVLIRKTKALTGLTPIAFLNTYKLNVAYELILTGGLSVNEASYKVGFSDPNYFTTCFKKQFGKNPSKLRP